MNLVTTQNTREDPMAALLRHPVVYVPAHRPDVMCKDRGDVHVCNRRAGHGGRHSFCWYGLGGVVRAVWGGR